MKTFIHLNADIGELPEQAGRDIDASILNIVSQCNIACGGHAGDPTTMRATVRAAKAHNVQIGAHPSYPDREGFGRRSIDISVNALENSLITQIKTLVDIAEDEGTTVAYVKPHGALYNDAVNRKDLAETIAYATQQTRVPAIMSLPRSEVRDAAATQGLQYIAEAFADRAYQANGQLMPRSMSGAVLSDAAACAAQAQNIALKQQLVSYGGVVIDCLADTITLHSDTLDSVAVAREIKQRLIAASVQIGEQTQVLEG